MFWRSFRGRPGRSTAATGTTHNMMGQQNGRLKLLSIFCLVQAKSLLKDTTFQGNDTPNTLKQGVTKTIQETPGGTNITSQIKQLGFKKNYSNLLSSWSQYRKKSTKIHCINWLDLSCSSSRLHGWFSEGRHGQKCFGIHSWHQCW